METKARRRVFEQAVFSNSLGERLDSLHRLTEIACFEHARELGFGDDVIRPLGWMWLIAKTSVTLKRPWKDGRIDVESMPIFGSATGLLWETRGFDEAGCFATQTYHWVLADQATGRPIRLPDHLRGLRSEFRDKEAATFDWAVIPDSTGDIVQTIAIPWADLDENGHVHNTHHVRYAFDCLDRWWTHYVIRYHVPLSAGIRLILRRSGGIDSLCLKGYSEDFAATPAFTVCVRE